MRTHRWQLALVFVAVVAAPQAQAQFAVIDVGAIAQLIQQVATMRDQLMTAKDQLDQARDALNSMRGRRGMEGLLSGEERNYLPADWPEWERTLQQATREYRALSRDLDRIMRANEVLTPDYVARWTPDQRERFLESRRSAAAMQMMSRKALESTSARFDSIEQLVRAIGSAADQKAILDLNARIAAEQAMLQNEHTKLGVMYEAMRAEETARKQRARELAIQARGSLRSLPPMGL
jgi:type IV secretion system protein VirB5